MGAIVVLHGVERSTPLTYDEMEERCGRWSSNGNAVPLLWFGFFPPAYVRWIEPRSADCARGYHEMFAPRDAAFANLRAFAQGLCTEDSLRPHVTAAAAALEKDLARFAGIQMDFTNHADMSFDHPEDCTKWFLPYVEGVIDGSISGAQIFGHPLAEGVFATSEIDIRPPRTAYGGTKLMEWLISGGLPEFRDKTN